MIRPVMQWPHYTACSSMKACCSGSGCAEAPGLRASLRWRCRLDLHGNAVLPGVAAQNDEIAALDALLSVHDLSNGSDGVDDGRAGRIRREFRERFARTATVRLSREREHIFLFRREAARRRLQHLRQSLIEQGDARGWLRVFCFALIGGNKSEMSGLPRVSEWLQ